MSEHDVLLQDGPRREVILGNYAFVRGMIEAGVQVAACYPGSPTAEMADAMLAIADRAGIYFEISTNEKVALEVAATSAIVGRPAVCWMKSVGLNVASDTAVQLPLLTMPGGLVVILGDDPGPLSSQNEQDNRHFARMAFFPMLEPATAQEAKDYFLAALSLSQKLKTPVLLRATTRTCHQSGLVEFGPRKTWDQPPAWSNEIMTRDGGYVPLPATVLGLKRKALENLAKFQAEAGALGLDRVIRVGPGRPRIRIISAGHAAQAVLSALEHLEADAEVLKLAQTHPLPVKIVTDFLQGAAEVHVLEELDPILETEIKTLCYDQGITTRIIGKLGLAEELELRLGEFDPTRMVRVLAHRLGVPDKLDYVEPSLPVPPRSPQLCPGCGHRTAFLAAKEALGQGKEAFSLADIGCYSLGYLPPYRLGNLLFCMGSGAPAASAMAKAFPDEPVLSFVGDSTFFHAALPGIVNAVYNQHRQVLLVMDNGITAMTGHQPNPNSGFSAHGETPRISIDEVCRAIGVKFLERVPAYNVAKLKETLQRAVEFAHSPQGGVAVVIQDEPCALRKSRAELRAGTLAKPMMVDLEACRNIQKCLKHFACPAINVGDDDRVFITTDLCIGDASCVQTCPLKDKPIKRLESFQRI